jgi:hypothetical protein
MERTRKLSIFMLAIILTVTSLGFTCQADTSGSASQQKQLYIRGPSQVAEGRSFQIVVATLDGPVANAAVSVPWVNTVFHTDANGVVTITAPWVDRDSQSFITASKLGYLSAKFVITIMNLAILPR